MPKSPEQQHYEPTREEIKQAEELMTPQEKEQSWERATEHHLKKACTNFSRLMDAIAKDPSIAEDLEFGKVADGFYDCFKAAESKDGKGKMTTKTMEKIARAVGGKTYATSIGHEFRLWSEIPEKLSRLHADYDPGSCLGCCFAEEKEIGETLESLKAKKITAKDFRGDLCLDGQVWEIDNLPKKPKKKNK